MSLFGRSSYGAFMYGNDQGIDNSLQSVRFATTGDPNVIRATFTLTDGTALRADLNLSGVNPFDQSLSSGDPVQFHSCSLLNGLDMNSNRITELADPVAGTDAANKTYVDSAIAGLTLKQPVKAATTTAGTLATSFANGQVVDGITLATGNRLLIKDQADAKENGLYVVAASGAPSRAADADNSPSNEVAGGMFVFVEAGVTNGETGWVLTSPNGAASLGTDNLVFTQFSAFTYTAGTGLSVSNRQFSVQYGTTSGTACQGNDSRLSDSRQCNNSFDSASTARTNLGLGSVATQALPSAGLVTSTGSALSSQAMPAAGLVTSNGTALDSQSMPTAGVVTSNGTALGSLAWPSAGYVKSNGTTFTSVTSVPNTDVSGLGTMSTQNSSNVSITGGSISGVSFSGTGFLQASSNLSDVSSASTARTNLGLGSMATQSAGSVAITGGTISGITNEVTLRGPSFFQLGVGSDSGTGGYGGAWVHSSTGSQALLAGGGKYTGSWMAGSTAASVIDMNSGSIYFQANSGLTAGNSFTPTTRLTVSPTAVTFAVPPVYKSNYPVGSRERDDLRIVAGVLDMTDYLGSQSGVGWHMAATGGNLAGSIYVAFDTGFSSIVSIQVTPTYQNDAENLGVCAYIRRGSTSTDGFRIQTINTGTGGLISLDATGTKISAHFLVIGY